MIRDPMGFWSGCRASGRARRLNSILKSEKELIAEHLQQNGDECDLMPTLS